MKKKVELPLVEPMFSTYHFEASGAAIIHDNPSIRNWYLNNIMILTCNRRFLTGYTSPEVQTSNCSWTDNPYIERFNYSMRYLNGYIPPLICNLIDDGYYVFFAGIDDYYMQGKSWYQKRHFNHDGIICGYNQEDKTYCVYAYDTNWVYQKFWMPQKCFDAGRKSMFKQDFYGTLSALKAQKDNVEFLPELAISKMKDYLDSSLEKFPEDQEGRVAGIVVHDYLAKYLDKLYDGSIPYERMDPRIFRPIWENKRVMQERIECIESALDMPHDISEQYRPLVSEADTIRMLYAAYHRKQRNSLLPVMRAKLLEVRKREEELLHRLIDVAE